MTCDTINAFVQSQLLNRISTFNNFNDFSTDWLSKARIDNISDLNSLNAIFVELRQSIILNVVKDNQSTNIGKIVAKLNLIRKDFVLDKIPKTDYKCKIRYLNALTFLLCFKMIEHMKENGTNVEIKKQVTKLLTLYTAAKQLVTVSNAALKTSKTNINPWAAPAPAPSTASLLTPAFAAPSAAPAFAAPFAAPSAAPAFAAPSAAPAPLLSPAPAAPEHNVQTDITNLRLQGEKKDIETFLFSTQSLHLLNKPKFKDLSKNNLYFNIDFNRHKLTPKAGPYYNRTFSEYADLLRAMLETGRPGIKTLKYPTTMPVTNAGKMVTSVIADMNHDFKYIEPRLSALNPSTVSSFFTSNKGLAVNQVLNTTKKKHEEEFADYKLTTDFLDKQNAIKQFKTLIDTARTENVQNNNTATAQKLEEAKEDFKNILKGFISSANYKEEKKFYEKEKARVLSNKDLYRRAGQQVWETEAPITDAATARAAGGRTRKRR